MFERLSEDSVRFDSSSEIQLAFVWCSDLYDGGGGGGPRNGMDRVDGPRLRSGVEESRSCISDPQFCVEPSVLGNGTRAVYALKQVGRGAITRRAGIELSCRVLSM